jgi:hypothetical protein
VIAVHPVGYGVTGLVPHGFVHAGSEKNDAVAVGHCWSVAGAQVHPQSPAGTVSPSYPSATGVGYPSAGQSGDPAEAAPS